MKVHLLDGTWELFRNYFAAPSATSPGGKEVGATRGLLRSLAAWLGKGEVTHAGIAFDTVIESFRNQLFDGYKTGEGVEAALLAQFPLAERAAEALGLAVWRMVEFEADDALATFAARADADRRVTQVLVCANDKDLTQCVRGQRVVLYDRFKDATLDEDGVRAKFGVSPESIPDLLALIGDTADGIPGLARWGEKSAGAVLARYRHLEDIPDDPAAWAVKVRGAAALAATLREGREASLLYRRLATLRRDVPLPETVEGLAWRGARRDLLEPLCRELGEKSLLDRIGRWA